ncbi:hypothetical protein [Streptomyces sp. SAI-041]|uniref:hypothetical protein n=1 Tax=Streptomyces sp. SAI-041 TaxID=2940548 RepID=UPI00247420BD|nr:hypothetical protein [Streptomyces sp. SAI-041]MDH6552267.1 hypothetical protein [Streptomyces sp. SAI-041]
MRLLHIDPRKTGPTVTQGPPSHLAAELPNRLADQPPHRPTPAGHRTPRSNSSTYAL